jgi:hypothetical protein
MARLLDKLYNLTLLLLALYATTAAIAPLFGYQLFIMPIKFETFQNLSFDYIRLLLLRSCVFITMAIFLLNYAFYKRPYSALAPLVVFFYSMSFFEFLSIFLIQQTTEYSSNPFAIVIWLIIAVLTHYKNSKSADTIFRN